MGKQESFHWLKVSAEEAARRLLGCELVRKFDDKTVRVRIVETEAYDQTDEASHAFGGERQRNKSMFMSAGHLYVYFTYGMHYCCNIVCGPMGFGSGALIRAVEPLEGDGYIEARRGYRGVNSTNGPGKVCAALGIDRLFDGHDLARIPLRLIERPSISDNDITITSRIGISKATQAQRRFYITSSKYVSRRKR